MKNSIQSFVRVRELLEKQRARKLTKSIITSLSTTSVLSGYIVVSEYQDREQEGDSTLEESCEKNELAPITISGVALRLCIAVNSNYSGLPSGCPSSGSFVMLTAMSDAATLNIAYILFFK
jgi:hypothetical protein